MTKFVAEHASSEDKQRIWIALEEMVSAERVEEFAEVGLLYRIDSADIGR